MTVLGQTKSKSPTPIKQVPEKCFFFVSLGKLCNTDSKRSQRSSTRAGNPASPSPFPHPKLPHLYNVKHGLELDNQLPLVTRHLAAVKLLEAVDAGARNQTVELVRLLEVAAVRGLVTAHLDLDGDRGLGLFADGDLLVVALDRGAVLLLVARIKLGGVGKRTLFQG